MLIRHQLTLHSLEGPQWLFTNFQLSRCSCLWIFSWQHFPKQPFQKVMSNFSFQKVLNPYLAKFSFNFSFMYKFNWPKFHEFAISHIWKRPRAWSNPGSENEILFPNYLAISFSLPNTISNQPLVGIHLPVVSSILAHLGLTVFQMWGRSVL